MTFGRRIKELRQKKDWSVYDLAGKLRNEKGQPMTAGYISKIEVRGEIPSPDIIAQLADVLGAKAEDLFELAKQEKTRELKERLDQKFNDALTLYRKSKKR